MSGNRSLENSVLSTSSKASPKTALMEASASHSVDGSRRTSTRKSPGGSPLSDTTATAPIAEQPEHQQEVKQEEEADAMINEAAAVKERIAAMESSDDEAEADKAVLNKQHMRCSLSNLGHIADGVGVAFLRVSLRSLGLRNIERLSEYVHLQDVDLSDNTLEDILVIGALPHLVTLNCAKNKLSSFVDALSPCINLQNLDVSLNQITSMEKYSGFKYLQVLNLSGNKIEEIDGLEGLASLRELNLSDNKIKAVRGLQGCRDVRRLDLSKNEIQDVSGVRDCLMLEELRVEDNEIMDISHLTTLTRLHTLELRANNIHSLRMLSHLKPLALLRLLTIGENPLFHQLTSGGRPDSVPGGADADLDDPENAFTDIVQPDEPGVDADGKECALVNAAPLRLVPEDEDDMLKGKLSPEQLFRLKVLWCVPQVWSIDGAEVTVDEKVMSANLEGGEDRRARRETHETFFSDTGDGTHLLKKVKAPKKPTTTKPH
eukprot:PhM_4_TR2141/c0_g1_i1/m.87475